jgi:hypothetical protein
LKRARLHFKFPSQLQTSAGKDFDALRWISAGPPVLNDRYWRILEREKMTDAVE